VPGWVGEQVDTRQAVPLLPKTAISMPMEEYAPLLADFLAECSDERGLRLADYLARRLGKGGD
jgi:hypothetical protein